MTETIKILLIDSDKTSRKQIAALVNDLGEKAAITETGDLTGSLDLIIRENPNLAILDLGDSADAAIKLAAEITRKFPWIALIVTSTQKKSDLILKAMRAGAREFLTKPIKVDDLSRALNTLSVRLNSSQENIEPGKIISIFGLKGGIGATTIATNLAVNFAARSNEPTLFADLNLQSGNSSLFFDIGSRYSIADLINNSDGLESDVIRDALPYHKCGVHVLSEPVMFEHAEMINKQQVDESVHLLEQVFSYLVFDLGATLNDVSLRALDLSKHIIAVMGNDLPSVYNARRYLDALTRMGYGERIIVAINRYDSVGALAVNEIQNSLAHSIFWKIPNQKYELATRAVNEGMPVSLANPKAKISSNFRELAMRLNGGKDLVIDQNSAPDKGILKSFIRNFREK